MLQRVVRNAENWLESALFASRWILAPFYAGLAVSLLLLMLKFLVELFHMAVHAFSSTETDVILGVLSLVDLALTGSLIVIVIFSGYENFVSKIDHSNHEDWPEWMGTIDFTALKLKLLSSIVAISAIQLLKQFMAVKPSSPGVQPLTDRELFWYVTIHLVFVVSSVLLALSDRIAGHGNHGSGHGHTGKADEPGPAPAPARERTSAPQPAGKEQSKPGATPGKKH